MSRTDGAQVEMSLLRPVAWIEQYGLEPGKQFTLVLSENEVDGRATVHKDYHHLLDAAQSAWEKVCLVPEMIQSICHAPYANSAVFS